MGRQTQLPPTTHVLDTLTSRALPVEILLRILMELQATDILTCKLVSRHFNKVIAGSLQLQYIIELAIASYVDIDTAPNLSTAEKIDRLRTLQKNWEDLTCTKTVILTRGDGEFEYNNGVYVSATMEGDDTLGAQGTSTQVELVELPSRLSGYPDTFAKRTLAMEGGLLEFMIDVEHDLFVMVSGQTDNFEDPESYEYSQFQVLFRTLSTGMPHPLAKEPHVVHNLAKPDEIGDLTILLAEEHVAITFPDGIKIWNWQTGRLIGEITETVESCNFLDPHHIAAMIRVEDPAVKFPEVDYWARPILGLAVFALPPEELDTRGPNMSDSNQIRCRHVATFEFPRTQSKWRAAPMVCRSYPPPTYQRGYNTRHGPSRSPVGHPRHNYIDLPDRQQASPVSPRVTIAQKPFRVDASRRVVSIVIDFWGGTPNPEDDVDDAWSLRLLTLDYVLLKRISQGKAPDTSHLQTLSDASASKIVLIPWSDWAQFARCFIHPPHQPEAGPPGGRGNAYGPAESIQPQSCGLRVASICTEDPARLSLPGPPPEMRLRLLDFNQAAVRRQINNPLTEGAARREANNPIPRKDALATSNGPTLVIEGDKLDCPDIFVESFVCGSSLPYRVTASTEKFPGLSRVLLDGERASGGLYGEDYTGEDEDAMVDTVIFMM